jgi:hypothetical protein
MEDLKAYGDICLEWINATQRSAVLRYYITTLLYHYIPPRGLQPTRI